MRYEYEITTPAMRAGVAASAAFVTVVILAGIVGLAWHYDRVYETAAAGRPAVIAHHGSISRDVSGSLHGGAGQRSHQY